MEWKKEAKLCIHFYFPSSSLCKERPKATSPDSSKEEEEEVKEEERREGKEERKGQKDHHSIK